MIFLFSIFEFFKFQILFTGGEDAYSFDSGRVIGVADGVGSMQFVHYHDWMRFQWVIFIMTILAIDLSATAIFLVFESN